MAGYARECDGCDELHYDDDMEEIGDAWYCEDCVEDERAEELEAEEKEAQCSAQADGIPAVKHRCIGCGKEFYKHKMLDRLKGWTCVECSHPQEVQLLGYCDLGCALCKAHPEWAKLYTVA